MRARGGGGVPGENKGGEEKVGRGICKKAKYQKF